jgi:hypothetical protein
MRNGRGNRAVYSSRAELLAVALDVIQTANTVAISFGYPHRVGNLGGYLAAGPVNRQGLLGGLFYLV